GIVEFEVNRGFCVADLGLNRVLERLEVRSLVEPEIARIAAERRTESDLADMRRAIDVEHAARTSDDAHDASRAFHVAIARATRNDALVRLIESLWIADVGRRLLAQ